MGGVVLDFKPKADIGAQTFADCPALSSVSVTGSVNFPDQAFFNCGRLNEVRFFDCEFLGKIGNRTFDGCSSLISVRIPDIV